jgi:hypothetical protein
LARKPASVLEKRPISRPVSNHEADLMQAQVYPDAWARYLKLAVDAHPFDTRGREYEVAIIRDESERIVIPKGAQMGLTTVFLIRTFHWLTRRKWKHLYLLPLKTGAIPFVQGRMDRIIDSNLQLKRQFASVDNRLHKQTSRGVNLYIRGTNIWTELREIPIDVLVMDERDKMIEENVPEAEARLDGSNIARIVELSTPTNKGHGVDSEDAWGASDQHRWYVPCPHCSRRQTFTVDENVWIGDSADECYVFCKYCREKITDLQRAAANEFGSWEADRPNGDIRGYHINQLHSPTKPIAGSRGFMDNYFRGQSDAKRLRAWWNNNRGEPYSAPGDKFTPELLDKCRGDHTLGGLAPVPYHIGVDVGSVLHVSASFVSGKKRIKWRMFILSGKDAQQRDMWGQLRAWLDTLGSFVLLIDAEPERTKAADLSRDYPGRVWIAFEKDRPTFSEVAQWDKATYGESSAVRIDRTMAFDSVIQSYLNGNTILSADARDIGEPMPTRPYNGFYFQMCQMARSEEEEHDKNGNVVGTFARWRANKNKDHWHHADMFEWVAMQGEATLHIPAEVGEIFARSGNFIG